MEETKPISTPQDFMVEDAESSSRVNKEKMETPQERKKEEPSLTKEIIAILESKRNQLQKGLIEEKDNNEILVAHIKKLTEPDFQVDISLEIKMKHLIDIYSKIFYINKGQMPFLNYNLQDAPRIVDSMGGVISSTGYYKKKELQEAFEVLNIEERFNKVHNLASKYLTFLQNFSDVGVDEFNYFLLKLIIFLEISPK